jgi:acetylornithine deacetylase/succinyl-diaminopimelate desuccinylase-like protein
VGSVTTLSARLREDVEALSAIERRAATPGDRVSAEWVAGRMRGLGLSDVRIEPFRCHQTWAIPFGAHNLLGMLVAGLPAILRVPLALALAASYESDYLGRDQTLRALVPGAGEGHNVVGRIEARGERRRTLVLVAHHDAAHTGWVWDPRFLESGRNYARKTGTTPSFIGLPLLALVLVALGARRLGRALLALGLGLGVQSALSQTVPGASDNASGVAGVLELARRYAEDPLDDTEVVVLVPSGEEVGLAGMYAWCKKSACPRFFTLVLGLDTLGAGEPALVRGESFSGRYREVDLALVEPEVPRVVLGAGTDPMAAKHAGMRAVSIVSWADGGFTNYHLPTDTPDRVSWESVERCVDLADRTVRRWLEATPEPSR